MFLDKILSVKNEYDNTNSHKVIYICGIKFSFRRKKIEPDDYEAATIESIWRTYGAVPELLARLQYLSLAPYQWNIQPNFIWLIYISCLVEKQDNDLAIDILKKYIDKYNYKDIERYLLVAKLAYENNYKSELIEKANYVLHKLEENRNNKLFEKIIEGKTIAIVGNGPSEIGKNKGKEIDSHDIVIRFNNYQIKGYENDYGTKTDIWVKCSNDDIKHDIKDNKISLILYKMDYHYYELVDGYLETLYSSEKPIDYLTFNDYIELRAKLNMKPTSGLCVVNKVLKCNTSNVDIYGFAFLENITQKYCCHYFNDRTSDEDVYRTANHSLVKESEYLQKIFIKN